MVSFFQIGDFGMARDLMKEENNYYKSSGGVIPIKWTAPEVNELGIKCTVLSETMKSFHCQLMVE